MGYGPPRVFGSAHIKFYMSSFAPRFLLVIRTDRRRAPRLIRARRENKLAYGVRTRLSRPAPTSRTSGDSHVVTAIKQSELSCHRRNMFCSRVERDAEGDAARRGVALDHHKPSLFAVPETGAWAFCRRSEARDRARASERFASGERRSRRCDNRALMPSLACRRAQCDSRRVVM